MRFFRAKSITWLRSSFRNRSPRVGCSSQWTLSRSDNHRFLGSHPRSVRREFINISQQRVRVSADLSKHYGIQFSSPKRYIWHHHHFEDARTPVARGGGSAFLHIPLRALQVRPSPYPSAVAQATSRSTHQQWVKLAVGETPVPLHPLCQTGWQ